jgi:hypothetical protein
MLMVGQESKKEITANRAMRCMESMEGRGIVTADDGQKVSVEYELNVYQEGIPAGSMADPHATIPRFKDIRGRIKPVCYFGQVLRLEMEDGRKLRFSFKDTDGNIALSSWIG